MLCVEPPWCRGLAPQAREVAVRLAVALMLACILWMAPARLEAASASLSSSQIFEYETVVLLISGSSEASPDISPLEQDFEVVGSSTQNSVQIVNGRIQVAENLLKLTLRPKRAGRITIPPIQFGQASTQPLQLEVLPLGDEPRRRIAERAFFELEVSNEAPYQGELIYLTRSLLYAPGVQIHGNLPSIPDVAGATVQPLGEPRSGEVERNGRRYGVYANEYLLVADQPGRLSIPVAEVMARVQSADLAQGRPLDLPIRTRPTELEVRPPPAEYPANKPWLPAHKVSIDSDFDSAQIQVGIPLTFNVRVSVEGALASQVAPLNLTFPASIRSYTESPRLEDTLAIGQVRGERIERYSLVPVQAGIVTLPAVEVTWWDTQGNQLRTARLAEREIEILANPDAALGDVTPTPEEALPGEQPEVPERRQGGFDWLDATLGILCLVLAGGWLLSARPDLRRTLLAVLSGVPGRAHLTRLAATEKSPEALAFGKVQAAQGQAALILAIRAWLRLVPREASGYGACEALLRHAEAALYDDATRHAGDDSPSAQTLCEAASEVRKAWHEQLGRSRSPALPALYG